MVDRNDLIRLIDDITTTISIYEPYSQRFIKDVLSYLMTNDRRYISDIVMLEHEIRDYYNMTYDEETRMRLRDFLDIVHEFLDFISEHSIITHIY
jgi:hypothetical protein